MKKILALFTLLSLSYIAKAGPGPSSPLLCLDALHPNRDSAYVDTNASSSTYRQFYCQNGFEVRFNYYVISSLVDTLDSVLFFDWTDIDTSYPAIRSAFATLDSLAGNFTLAKPYPYITDTSSFLNKDFFVRFDSLLDVDSALAILSTIPGTTVAWRGRPVRMDYIPNVNGMIPGLDFSTMTLDHSSLLSRYCHPLGWQWNNYVLHCPMAWEISKGLPAPEAGHKYIHVIGDDEFNPSGDPSTNPDIVPNFVQMDPSGSTGEQANGLQSPCDGAKTLALGGGHGHLCLSQAVSAGVNSMIGTCPECKGIALDGVTQPYGIDVDGVTGNGITPPEVEWSSADEGADFVGGMSAGMAIFSAAGNTLNNDEGRLNINYEFNPSNPSQVFLYPMVSNWPGYTAIISGGTDPTKDVHPLCVGGMMDGTNAGAYAYCPSLIGTYFRSLGPEQSGLYSLTYLNNCFCVKI